MAPIACRTTRWLVAALVLLAAHPAGAAPEPVGGAGYIRWPATRVRSLDLRAWPDVELRLSVVGSDGVPLPLEDIRRVEVIGGRGPRSEWPTWITFEDLAGASEHEQPNKPEMVSAAKAGGSLAVMVVVAGHQGMRETLLPASSEEADEAQDGAGTIGARIKDGLGGLFKALTKGAGEGLRANVIWYGDRLLTLTSLPGRAARLSAVQTVREECAFARALAQTGQPYELVQGVELAPGTDPCGLVDDAGKLGKLLESPSVTFSGYYPRLFGLGPPAWDPSRYCAAPAERLATGRWGLVNADNASRWREAASAARRAGRVEPFASSAFDEALEALLRGAPPEARRVLLLVSDGRDGYLRDEALCQASPPEAWITRCSSQRDRAARLARDGEANQARLASRSYRDCIGRQLAHRRTTAQRWFAERAERWIGLARAADIEVHAVGIAAGARRDELERLAVLAVRTGGSYREAEAGDVASIQRAIEAMGQEVAGDVVLRFRAPPDVARGDEALAVQALVAADGERLEAPLTTVEIPTTLPWTKRAPALLWTHVLVPAQDRLGYETYVWVLRVLAAIGALVVLLIVWRIGRRIAGAVLGGGPA